MIKDMGCDSRISIRELEFPQGWEVRCQKHANHSGMHYSLDRLFQWQFFRLDGTQRILIGKAEFGWNLPDVWVYPGMWVATGRDDGAPRKAEFDIHSLDKDEDEDDEFVGNGDASATYH